MNKIIGFLLIAITLSACNNGKNAEDKNDNEKMIPVEGDGVIGDGAISIEQAFAKGIEKSHNKEKFMSHKAVSFDLLLNFGGKERLDAKVTMLTNSSKVKIELKDNSAIIFDGENVYTSPSNVEKPMARFDVLTWSYFFAMPFKLTDPGTNWSNLEQADINGNTFTRAKLTFESETGDTAEDWYWAYVDNKTNLLTYAPYIVTFGSNVNKAEENPHAIVYSNYAVVDSVAIADQWKFYNWSQEQELYGDPIGDAKITNIQFLETADFTVPTDSKTVAMPPK